MQVVHRTEKKSALSLSRVSCPGQICKLQEPSVHQNPESKLSFATLDQQISVRF